MGTVDLVVLLGLASSGVRVEVRVGESSLSTLDRFRHDGGLRSCRLFGLVTLPWHAVDIGLISEHVTMNSPCLSWGCKPRRMTWRSQAGSLCHDFV